IYENVAHDLRTPLVSILGYADGLKSGIIKNKNKACDVIIKTGNQLKEMIENILVLSRFDNDTYKGNFEDISVIDLINEQIEVVKVINDEIKISLNADFKNDFIINSDKKLLTRIIQNILSNAIKYAKSEIIINVDAKQNKLKNQSNNKIEISITDDGDGIKKKDLQDIFTRYYKGEDGHFGIGLAVVKSSVEYLNGDISVKSVKGKGTTFKIKI
ncbi:MAG: HAMP domain-containing histidine kinase, partial [Lachnospiraceae bacterium]|nr:HAMP domain-containing histidine kinase [Lachnospiraceae bacterium]